MLQTLEIQSEFKCFIYFILYTFCLRCHYRIISSASHISVDCGKHSRMRCHLHGTEFTTHRQSIFGILSHCRFIRRVACNDICWREWHSRWVFFLALFEWSDHDSDMMCEAFTFLISFFLFSQHTTHNSHVCMACTTLNVNKIKSQFPFFSLPRSGDIHTGYWIFGAKFCDTWVAFDVMCSTASILNLCAISLDRYIHIKDPLR